jgi:hypothetical protein
MFWIPACAGMTTQFGEMTVYFRNSAIASFHAAIVNSMSSSVWASEM